MTEPTAAHTAEEHPLILVTLGTSPHPFPRLVEWVDTYAAEHPGIRILVQHGHTPPPTVAEGTAFLGHEHPESAIRTAVLVVTHGEPGAIATARRTGHVPIAVARDPNRGEHHDSQQSQFIAHLDAMGLIRACSTEQQLTATLEKALVQPSDFRLDSTEHAAPRATAARRAGDLVDLLAPPDPPDLAASPTTRANTTWPDVTVVVPTRDHPELLKRAVTSITAQNYPGVIRTLIVYDGAHPDPTLRDDSSNRPVRVLTNVLTPGLPGARNTGIRTATSRLVAFCGDGDMWLAGKLRAQVDVMHANPSVAAVCCAVRPPRGAAEPEGVPVRSVLTFADLLRYPLTDPHPSTFLVRRDVLVHGCGPFNAEIPGDYGNDHELILRLTQRAPIGNVTEEGVRVVEYRDTRFSGPWSTVARALQWLLARYPEYRLIKPGYARITARIAVAEAASGRRVAALTWAFRALRTRPTETRALLAITIACGLPARWVEHAVTSSR